ncbi:MAG: phage Gp37/Gp68 family protein, partial [Symbiobacteriaceae bacterium]|nr:phage Gp37/Gp68 family protein [Symbiobacteriaceae bacterium]
GCKYCYCYGELSKRFGESCIRRTDDFTKPVDTIYMPRKKVTKFRIEGGQFVNTCFYSDFFIPEADPWRLEAWQMMRQRPDLHFLFLTKRIERFPISLPADWGDGYDNVTIGVSVENQEMADQRLPVFLSFPIKNRIVVPSPLLEQIDISAYLHGIRSVSASGESGREARVCDLNWIINLREQCIAAGVRFDFRYTGSRLLIDGVLHKIHPNRHAKAAREMGLSTR